MSHEPSTEDRLAIRQRPSGFPLMYQTWGKLLFMHWPIELDLLRPLIPSQLSIDTFDGRAWIGVVPFTMWGIRASFLPRIPGTSAFHELNVRTYVHYQGVPGVWFFSLDAANSLAVWGARTFYHLPYFNAKMSLKQEGTTIRYSSTRSDDRTYAQFFAGEKGMAASFASDQFQNLPRAALEANWIIGDSLGETQPESIEFFLTERYCLYSCRRGQIYRSRIFHETWPLRAASLESIDQTMIESLGVMQPTGEPQLHYAEKIDVEIWSLQRVSTVRVSGWDQDAPRVAQ